MLFRAQKDFKANGRNLLRGDTIELEPSPRTQTLIDTRYLLPADPEVATASVADDLVSHSIATAEKRRGRPPK